MAVRPRPLPEPVPAGAKVGVFSLSGPVAAERLAAGVRRLEEAGFRVLQAPNLRMRDAYLAGGDAERVAGLEWLLDRGVEVLLAARGGYGAMRVLPALPWARLASWSGWIVGFSDITAIHAAAGSRFPRATLLGPMAATLPRHPGSTGLLFDWLHGRAPERLFDLADGNVVRPGSASGLAIGGTLSILASLIGTGYEPEYSGAVLFLEDVGEPTFRLDRLLTQLRLSSRLARVEAIVAGRLSRCGRGEAGWRERWRALLAEAAPRAVIVEGVPFGHGSRHVTVPLGVEVALDTRSGTITWGGSPWRR
ncbi:MAG: S66 peptidase family protein [Acidobacteriota bacterium]